MGGISKACTKCKEEKPPEAFHRASHSKDGRREWCKACVAAYMLQRSERIGREQLEQRESALRQQAAQATAPPLYFGSFSLEIAPHVRVRIEGIPSNLTRAQADKLKRLISAYIDPDGPTFPPDVDLDGVEVVLSGRRLEPPEGHSSATTPRREHDDDDRVCERAGDAPATPRDV